MDFGISRPRGPSLLIVLRDPFRYSVLNKFLMSKGPSDNVIPNRSLIPESHNIPELARVDDDYPRSYETCSEIDLSACEIREYAAVA
jgi:hypothetical protein